MQTVCRAARRRLMAAWLMRVANRGAAGGVGGINIPLPEPAPEEFTCMPVRHTSAWGRPQHASSFLPVNGAPPAMDPSCIWAAIPFPMVLTSNGDNNNNNPQEYFVEDMANVLLFVGRSAPQLLSSAADGAGG